MWYGTPNGLCRDDGYDVRIFRSDVYSSDVMESNTIWSIAEDTQKQLWLGTSKGVYILDKSTFHISPLDMDGIADRRVIFIRSTSDDNMWVSVVGSLYQFDPKGKLQETYTIETGTGYVEYLYEDKNHNIWICIRDVGLYRLDVNNKEMISFCGGKETKENQIIQDYNNNYWVGTWGDGIKRFAPDAPENNRYVGQPATQKDGRIISLIQDNVNGYIWATTYTGIEAFKINEHGILEQVETSAFISQKNKMLASMVKDSHKNLWVPAYDGSSFIINLQDNGIKEYSIPALGQRLNGNPCILSLCKEGEDLYWISQDRFGICLYRPNSDKLVFYGDCPETASLPLDVVPYLIKSKEKGKIWAMTVTSAVYGISHVNLLMRKEESIELAEVTDNPGTLETIFEDNIGDLWMGTTTGLFVYRPKLKTLEAINEITGNVSGITETNDGALWVCVSNKGVYRLEKESHELYPYKKDFSCIDATSDGKLWLGTFSGGVWLLDPKSEEKYTDYSLTCGMKGDVLKKIVVDDFNHVWFLTFQQVKEFNPRNNVFRTYTVPDNSLLLKQFLSLSAYKHSDNTLYLGGIPGFFSIKPDNRLESIPKAVKTVITDIKVSEKSMVFDRYVTPFSEENIEIEPDGYNIQIHFSTLDYWNVPQIRYAYKLLGVDKDWNYMSEGKNTAFYNQLKKGKYTFQVKATDENGLWSEQVTAYNIQKLPAWYETWWAYTLYCLIFLTIVWNALSFYLLRLKQKSNRKMIDQITRARLNYPEASSANETKNPSLPLEEENTMEAPPVVAIHSMETLSRDEQLIVKALEIVEANLSNPDFDVTTLAVQLHTTRVTLYRKIKAMTGQTAIEFIRDIKMKHARRMLENPAMSVSEVIAALGYNDHRHFTATFKNMFGITPSEYQKRKNTPEA
jgi:ligand-binding sensor domain-containing protein/AraC-like DNA-binding protein